MLRFVLILALFTAGAPSPRAQQDVARRPTIPPTTPRTIEIQAGDNMRFTPDRITARPGESLHVVLKDAGTMPKAAMAHNFVLLKKGADAKAFADKSAGARDSDFIAPAVKDQALAATKLVGPGEATDVTFQAPAAGTYTFICSFPGHYALGMKGTLVVK
jgi:azurin